MNFVLRWLATALAVATAIAIVPGIDLIGGNEAWIAVALFALILALINTSIKPILQILSLPVTFLTLGLFYLIVNTGMLYLSAWIANGIFRVGFNIETFGSAFVASIVISIVASIVNSITGAKKDKGQLNS